ncbi:agamous-like MADS-box protein AGL61 [Oryza brachyantha]|uniref:agamous-like MADS-box protein AGL61 n=1 Tax=Oryza brachyantha TaxID=4533 RepID=UPI001ADB4A31|nr:agamous-like MADS-box protein AGL61 [Oryza brachyantha]
MGRPRARGTSKGKQRIEIRYIEDSGKRQVSFSKRRAGLFKKASELCLLCGASVAVLAFSGAGNVFAFGGPSADAVVRHYYYYASSLRGVSGGALPSSSATAATPGRGCEEQEALWRAVEQTRAEVAAEEARARDIVDKVTKAVAGRRFWWDADVEALGEAELPRFGMALEKLRRSARLCANRLLLSAMPSPLTSPPPPPPSSLASTPCFTTMPQAMP